MAGLQCLMYGAVFVKINYRHLLVTSPLAPYDIDVSLLQYTWFEWSPRHQALRMIHNFRQLKALLCSGGKETSGINNNLGQDSSADGSISHLLLSSSFHHLSPLPLQNARVLTHCCCTFIISACFSCLNSVFFAPSARLTKGKDLQQLV